ncbi:NUDIX domain-containing protein [Thermobifida alba]|jgi:8-oxo-dGTP pyrophosphatase MutT (NUDIX family)|uniref:NUDIX domain-containing protein n=1 Tax=Thermobifida alba TaxID=53522 RepID=A0ABY4L0W3_THEAE|nr:NUDIX domain-containing protein [Thermobifida alba]UPT19968.1 NUDIX domain-containing protein [Thermobifida alba]
MTVTNDQIRITLDRYLVRFPDEYDQVGLLRQALTERHDLSSRKEFRIGHVTAGAAVVASDGRVLMIRHKALDTWLLPGGHLEPEDADLLAASLRELAEETGLHREHVEPLGGADPVPIDLDIHQIPANPAKGEPAHWHFDFRYLHRASAHGVRLQAEEVTGHAWRGPAELPSPRLVTKLTTITG